MGQTASRDGSAGVLAHEDTSSTPTSASQSSSSGVTTASTSPGSMTLDGHTHPSPTSSVLTASQDERDVRAEAGPSSKPYSDTPEHSDHAANASRPMLSSRPSFFRRRKHSKISIDSLPTQEQPRMRKRFLRSVSSPPEVINDSTDTALTASHIDAAAPPKRGLLSRMRARRLASSPSVTSLSHIEPTGTSSQPTHRRSSVSHPNIPALRTEITPSQLQKEANPSVAPADSEPLEPAEPPDDVSAAVRTPMNDATYPMTPPPESDVLLAERERVRSLIEAALHARPLPAPHDESQPAILEGDDGTATAASSIDAGGLDLATFLAARLALPPSTPSSESGGDVQMVDADMMSARAEAVNPQSANVPTTAVPVASASTTALQDPQTALSAPIPRRILVQGIVARAEPRPSTAVATDVASSSGPSAEGMNEQPTRPIDEQATSTATTRANTSSADAIQRHEEVDTTWSDAVNELLNMRPDDDHTSRAAAQADDTDLENVTHQAVLIGRLLSIAAAATAATLLPGAISVNGSIVSGFDDDATTLPFGSPASAAGPASTAAAPTISSRARSDSLPTRSRSIAPFRGRSHPAQAEDIQGATEGRRRAGRSRGDSGSGSSGTLQDVLRNALAAAFGGGSLLRNRTETVFADPSPVPTPQPASPVMSSQPSLPAQPTGPSSASATSPLASPALPLPTGRAPAVSIQVSSLEQDPRLTSVRNAPEGSFERFLSDLQTDVSSAIIQTHRTSTATQTGTRATNDVSQLPPTNTATTQDSSVSTGAQPATPALPEPGPGQFASSLLSNLNRPQHAFAYFRSFRFPARPFSEIAPDSRGAGIPLSNERGQNEVSNSSGVTHSVTSATQSTPLPAAISADTAAAGPTTTPAASTPYVPMILVGIRSMQPQAVAAATSGHSTNDGPSESATMSDEGQAAPTVSTQEPAVTSADSTQSGGGAVPQLPGEGLSGYVLWIMGGVYPANHPVVLAPSLLSDAALTYEDMMRLAEMLGQHKPPTASKEELAASDLPVIKAVGLPTMLGEAKVLPITAERCLVCLEDYEDNEDVRILHCQHCFHQGCVDRWLSDSANTCPVCRTAGVRKATSDPAATAAAEVATTPVSTVSNQSEDVEMQA